MVPVELPDQDPHGYTLHVDHRAHGNPQACDAQLLIVRKGKACS